MMGFKIRNSLSISRVYAAAALVFAESSLVPLSQCLQGGRFPNAVEAVSYVVAGAIQSVTLLLLFVKKDDADV